MQNVHERRIQTSLPLAAVGSALIDNLAGRGDVLWPRDRWPPMFFDRPLGVGASGGHGPLRYFVEDYRPQQSIRFRFTAPRGFVGTHSFDVEEAAPGVVCVRHTLAMSLEGTARLSWPLLFCWLHDALIEDALDRAQAHCQASPVGLSNWPLHVRVLRRAARYLR
ncbi:MAG: SRPBCC family protein [Acidobacteria bacterium]|nr:SRPBCC family protein [Acidobacteriota bacterium]